MSDPASNSTEPEPGTPVSPPAPTRPICRQCFELLDAEDNFCRCCGGITDFGTAMVKIGKLAAPVRVASPTKPPSWTESPALILPLLLLFIGPLAFPMLWRSRRFTLAWKIVLTVVVTGITVWCFWYGVVMFQQSWDQLQKALQ